MAKFTENDDTQGQSVVLQFNVETASLFHYIEGGNR